jgi:hypothetical protein
MAAGITGVLPLTGVVTPFLSYGGSAMAVNFASLGLLAALARTTVPAAASAGGPAAARAKAASTSAAPAAAIPASDFDPFAAPVRWVGRALAVAGVIVLGVAADAQVARADAYLTRPQMSVQADGGRRFHYNPRVLEAMRLIPRGSISDRNGVLLATSGTDAERAYPAGEVFFQILGDANTRANWGASNSTYVERDAEDVLRGFDDRASVVETRGVDGRPAVALKRDFSPVAALVRRRWQPSHPEIAELLARPRDVRLTIDARLQRAVGDILQRALGPSATNGAVVVLDAASGEILASVSYPFRELDRARYGLYPPGSTFKILTSAAALRADAGAASREFVCERVSPRRVGVRIPGFGPPILDDEHDEMPHGRIAMPEALAKSCNAYFAQLAVALGSDALTDAAAIAGISLTASTTPERVRANLPHAGYGQGEVVATPLRMARIAAAIASDGRLREAPIVAGSRTAEISLVSERAARQLARALREAVTSGTGRQLASHEGRIAGKTGTAEVDEASPHAWFVGFAPYATDTGGAGGDSRSTGRRIAFAVLLEHGGYGGRAAASIAGQVTSTARALGLIK